MKAGVSYYEPNQATSSLDIIINVCYCMVEILFFFFYNLLSNNRF